MSTKLVKKKCECIKCTCTPDNHCGCFDPNMGCTCGDNHIDRPCSLRSSPKLKNKDVLIVPGIIKDPYIRPEIGSIPSLDPDMRYDETPFKGSRKPVPKNDFPPQPANPDFNNFFGAPEG